MGKGERFNVENSSSYFALQGLLAPILVVRAIVCFSSDLQIKVIQLFPLVWPVNLCFSQNNQNNAYQKLFWISL